jgi:hypothetical protein
MISTDSGAWVLKPEEKGKVFLRATVKGPTGLGTGRSKPPCSKSIGRSDPPNLSMASLCQESALIARLKRRNDRLGGAAQGADRGAR